MVGSASFTAEDMVKMIASLTKTIEELNANIASLKDTIVSLQNTNKLLKEENDYLKRKLFSPKSEKTSSPVKGQLSLFDEAEVECNQELLEEITYTRAKKRNNGDRELKLEDLEHVKEVYDIAEKDRICDICGAKLKKVGEELVRQEVVYQPAKLYVKDIYRNTYECRNCRKTGKTFMMKAGTPSPVIPHSFTSSSVLNQILIDKYVNHMPLYRQESEWKRLGLDISRATMANWIIISANEYFIPLVNRMHELMVEEKHIHCDETTVQVLNEPGKSATSKSYMWVYSSIKESDRPIKIFEYQPDRKAINPQKFLKNFQGTIISDGYYGYNNICGVTNAYCWAHARRKFFDALPSDVKNDPGTLAKEALDKIADLFRIEKEIAALSAEEKQAKRQEISKPLVDGFFSWCRSNQSKVLSQSKIGKAIEYALSYEEGLRVYLSDGLVPMTNSLDERTIRPFTVGRKNWMFATSVKGAKASAAVYSLIETAKANHLDPYDYIEYLLDLMPNIDFNTNPGRLDEFLPWSKKTLSEFKNDN